MLKNILDQFLHSPSYQALEATWTGIQHILDNVNFDSSLKLKVLNASYEEIHSDITQSLSIDTSYLFKRLYEDGYGTYGGDAFTCLFIDHLITKNNDDVDF